MNRIPGQADCQCEKKTEVLLHSRVITPLSHNCREFHSSDVSINYYFEYIAYDEAVKAQGLVPSRD